MKNAPQNTCKCKQVQASASKCNNYNVRANKNIFQKTKFLILKNKKIFYSLIYIKKIRFI